MLSLPRVKVIWSTLVVQLVMMTLWALPSHTACCPSKLQPSRGWMLGFLPEEYSFTISMSMRVKGAPLEVKVRMPE